MQTQRSMKHTQVAFQEKLPRIKKADAAVEQLAGRRDPAAECLMSQTRLNSGWISPSWERVEDRAAEERIDIQLFSKCTKFIFINRAAFGL